MTKLHKNLLIVLGAAFIILGLMGCNRLFGVSGDLVERVSDGDTLLIRDAKGNKFTVRFACMDAPEIPHSRQEKASKRAGDRNQFNWGVKAQTRLEQLVRQNGDRVTLKITDSDRYGRKVAEVRLQDGTFVQQVLLQEGLAKVYRPYLNKCPSKELVQQAEAQAQQQKVGIWGDAKFINPWEYRSFNKRK
ncbi:micrococcal nuclease-like nuclease [Nostoc sp. PCC 7524]|uniref:thermonuclease family protein n=1 Tax=Nostoc sp. (strain ATCC 29411 / PCC 7524) TaxID=28072 RepID=UPI00029F1469|nr:thermonuclease family protein [Nostoc sp. PCC 7524]AFY47002.1 micrococcal nuclease-like nuclease [Nostoc sp. PCC 7524]